jgi:hypothetical protein
MTPEAAKCPILWHSTQRKPHSTPKPIPREPTAGLLWACVSQSCSCLEVRRSSCKTKKQIQFLSASIRSRVLQQDVLAAQQSALAALAAFQTAGNPCSMTHTPTHTRPEHPTSCLQSDWLLPCLPQATSRALHHCHPHVAAQQCRSSRLLQQTAQPQVKAIWQPQGRQTPHTAWSPAAALATAALGEV